MWETVSALCVVLGGIVVVCAGLRALGVGTGTLPRSRMRVVESLSLGNRQRLHVVEVDGERLLANPPTMVWVGRSRANPRLWVRAR